MYNVVSLLCEISCYSLFYTDFPDCFQIPSVCNRTQICQDTPPGSFTCSCPPGTSLNENGTCVIVGMCNNWYVYNRLTKRVLVN